MSDAPVNLSRRLFACSLGASAAALCGLELKAQDKDGDQKEPPTESDSPKDRDEDKKPPELDELLTQVIARQYPHSRLTPQVLNLIAGDISGCLRRSKILSSFPLRNSDEPATHFAAWRQEN